MASARLRTAAVLAVQSLVTTLVGCDRTDDPRKFFGRAESTIRPPRTTRGAIRLPPSCIDSVAQVSKVIELAHIAPKDLAQDPVGVDPGWYPVGLNDVVAGPDAIIALDSRGVQVSLLSPLDLAQQVSWGSRGSGSGEFRNPVAITLQSETRHLVVFDSELSRISYFDDRGSFVASRNTPMVTADAMAVAPNGDIYLGLPVWGKATSGDTSQRLLVKLASGDGDPETVITVAPPELGFPRFVLPGPNPVRVTARSGRLAVFFPAAGAVEVLEDSEKTAVFRTCMTPAMAQFYTSQLANAGPGTHRQSWAPLITDVYLHPTGDIDVVGPLRDEQGRYHIDRFAADGRPRGSIVLQSEQTDLYDIVRFGHQPGELIGFSHAGEIRLVRVKQVG